MMHEDDVKRKVLGHLMDAMAAHDRGHMKVVLGMPQDGDFATRPEHKITSEVSAVAKDPSEEHTVPVHEPIEDNMRESADEDSVIPDRPAADVRTEEDEMPRIDMIGLLAKRHADRSARKEKKY